MKKALLVAFIITAFSQARAQQLFNLRPSDSLKNNLYEQYLKVKPQNQLLLTLPPLNLNKTPALADNGVKISPDDHTPIAFLQGDSKMPVVKLEGADRMPILKLEGGAAVFAPDPNKQTP